MWKNGTIILFLHLASQRAIFQSERGDGGDFNAFDSRIPARLAHARRIFSGLRTKRHGLACVCACRIVAIFRPVSSK